MGSSTVFSLNQAPAKEPPLMLTQPNGPELARAARTLVSDYLAVREGERVLITADTATDMVGAEVVMSAALGVNAKPALLVIPRLPFQGALADPYIPDTFAGAVMACDVWVDLCFPYLAGSHLHDDAMKAERIRYFLGGDLASGGLLRLFGRVDLDAHFAVQEGFYAVIAAGIGKECRITSQRGTDVTFQLAELGFSKPRRGDRPGTYLVPGACTIFPELESVKGKIVVEASFHEYFTPLPEPLTITVDGRIRKISGGGSERRVLERALKRAGGGNYGYVIHFTHGIHPAAQMTGGSFIEDMRATGNNAIGMGLPWWVPGGGENHPDGIMRSHSIWVDGTAVVHEGDIVSPPALAELAAELTPRYV